MLISEEQQIQKEMYDHLVIALFAAGENADTIMFGLADALWNYAHKVEAHAETNAA